MLYVDDSRISSNGHLLYMADWLTVGFLVIDMCCVWIARESYSN